MLADVRFKANLAGGVEGLHLAELGQMAIAIVVVKEIRLDRRPDTHSRRRVVRDQPLLHIRVYAASRMES